MVYFSFWDIFIVPLYIGIAWYIARRIGMRKSEENPAYKYYQWGLLYKIGGAIALCLIYLFYYGGGDTTGYYNSAVALNNLLFEDPSTYFSILANNLTPENFSAFNETTGWPGYYHDPYTFTVPRFTSVLLLFTTGSFLQVSVLTAIVTYSGIWRLYLMFVDMYPSNYKLLAIAVLFIPSVAFWGSGVLKDSYTMAAAGWTVYSFYMIVFRKRKILVNLLFILISVYVLMSIKAYILFAIIGGLLIWMGFHYLNKLKSPFFRILVLPIIAFMLFGLGQYLIFNLGQFVGSYYTSMDALLEKAIITQDDLTRAYYGGNSFDIGELTPDVASVVSKFPVATIAGLYRPFIFEVRNPVMLLSAIENTFLLLLLLWVIYKVGLRRFIAIMFEKPVLLFAFGFTLLFAFSVGLTTANFGALVRYKIPLLPFYVAALFTIYFIDKRLKLLNAAEE
ncbi:MAG: hypothetical protein C0599_04705 [Salinivirgaceae bacterium]|nr:MAG: hypothetical protein C0599_04705 [Salinivirgaceae bacterium]